MILYATMFLPAILQLLSLAEIPSQMQFSLIFIFFTFSDPVSSDYRDLLLGPKAVCRCEGYHPHMETVMIIFTTWVKGPTTSWWQHPFCSRGDLGNKMLHYALAKALQQTYNVNVFITKSMYQTLKTYFVLPDHLPIAEYSLCGFEKFFKVYMVEYKRKMLATVEKETSRRKNGEDGILDSDLTSVLHSQAIYTTKYEVTESMR